MGGARPVAARVRGDDSATGRPAVGHYRTAAPQWRRSLTYRGKRRNARSPIAAKDETLAHLK
ncbi:hypothetical protein GCM10023063_04290 [Arthrobacter methylotrophus]